MSLERRTPLKRTEWKRTVRARSGWAKAKAAVRARSGGCCEANTPACSPGVHRGEHPHHVLMRSQGGNDEPGNLLWVCALAHGYIHANPAVSYERGWLRRRAA